MSARRICFILISLLFLAFFTISCDDKEKIQKAIPQDLTNKIEAEINRYPDLNGIMVQAIEPVSKDDITMDGDIYTAKVKVILANRDEESADATEKPITAKNTKTMDIVLTGTKDAFLTGNYTWKPEIPQDPNIIQIHSTNTCAFLQNSDSDATSLCNALTDVLQNETSNHLHEKCYEQYHSIYSDKCINYFQQNEFNHFDDTNYRFYETCFLLKSNNDYEKLIQNLVTLGVLNDVEYYLHTLDLKNPALQLYGSSSNCQTLCDRLTNSATNALGESSLKQCLSVCNDECELFCAKVHKNYFGATGAEQALLTIFAYSDYFNPEETQYVDQTAKKIIEEYGDKVAIFFGSNPKSFHLTNAEFNRLEEAAYHIKQGSKMHQFFVKNRDDLTKVSLQSVFVNEIKTRLRERLEQAFPKYKELFEGYTFNTIFKDQYRYSDLNIIKQFDPTNQIDLQSVANEMGIRGKGSIFIIHDKIVPIDTSYHDLKNILDQELAHASDIATQTGLKGLPLANYIRAKAYQSIVPKGNNIIELPYNTIIEKTSNKNSKNTDFIGTGFSPVLGNNNAPVTIVFFNDFLSKKCKTQFDNLMMLYKKYSNDIRIVFKHRPYIDYSKTLAKAAIAAQNQNQFWSFAEILYRPTIIIDEKLREEIHALGMNIDKFKADVKSPDTMARIDAGVKGYGVSTLLVNGRELTRNITFNELELLFLEEFNKAKTLYNPYNYKGEDLYHYIVTGKEINRERKSIDVTNGIHFGDPNAPVTVVLFIGVSSLGITLYYQSKHYLNNTGNKYHIIYKPMCIATDCQYAQALIAAAKQNFFMEMADFLNQSIIVFPEIDDIFTAGTYNYDDAAQVNMSLNLVDDPMDLVQEFVRSSGRDVDLFMRDYNSEETNEQIYKNHFEYYHSVRHYQFEVSEYYIINGSVYRYIEHDFGTTMASYYYQDTIDKYDWFFMKPFIAEYSRDENDP